MAGPLPESPNADSVPPSAGYPSCSLVDCHDPGMLAVSVDMGDGPRHLPLCVEHATGLLDGEWEPMCEDPAVNADSLYVVCPACAGTGQDPVAVALERLGAVLPLRCEVCGGTGRRRDGG
jgi:hypothetical protein